MDSAWQPLKKHPRVQISGSESSTNLIHYKTVGFQHPKELDEFGEFLQCGAPKIAKLVYNSSKYGLW